MDRLAVEEERALARRVEARQDLHQGRFAGAIVADDAQHLAGVDMEIHIAKRGDGAEIFVNAFRLEQRGRLIRHRLPPIERNLHFLILLEFLFQHWFRVKGWSD